MWEERLNRQEGRIPTHEENDESRRHYVSRRRYSATTRRRRLHAERKRRHRDLCDISVPKEAAAGPRQRDGVRGGGRGRPHRAAARQSYVVVSMAERVAAPAATGPLHRA